MLSRVKCRLGDIVSFGMGLLATFAALLFSMLVVAMRKLVYRPLVTVLLIALAGVGLLALAMSREHRSAARDLMK